MRAEAILQQMEEQYKIENEEVKPNTVTAITALNMNGAYHCCLNYNNVLTCCFVLPAPTFRAR
jgi:hypothetical protein